MRYRNLHLIVVVCLAAMSFTPLRAQTPSGNDNVLTTPPGGGTEQARIYANNGSTRIGTSGFAPSLLTVGTVAPSSPAITSPKLWVAGSSASPAGLAGVGTVIAMLTGGGFYVVNHADGPDVAAMVFRGGDAPGSKSRLLFTGDNSSKNSSIYNIVDVQAQSGHLGFATAPDSGGLLERVRITSAGRVGIGTENPSTLLHVAGDATFTGTVTGGNIQAKYQDIAEWVPISAPAAPGTVVVLDPTTTNRVTASSLPYDTAVAGVVSAQPGVILGEAGDSKAMIATTGRVKVRVDATNAPIQIGDLLVTSDTPGTAMKSEALDLSGIAFHRPGTLIGKALEPLAGGVGEILVLLSLQ